MNILLFEDSTQDAEAIFDSFSKLLPPDKSVTFVWFDMPFNGRIHVGSHSPIEFEKSDKIAHRIVISKGKVDHQQKDTINGSNKLRYYPAEFDAAIIDMYYNELDEGRKYIRWFETASFIRPVVSVSRMNNPTELFSELPLLRRIFKDNDNSWLSETVSYITDSCQLLQDVFPKTNCFGIAPEKVLEEYFKAYRRSGKRKYIKGDLMNYLWVSLAQKPDNDLNSRVKHFFAIEYFLNEMPELSSRYGVMHYDPASDNIPDTFLRLGAERNSEPHVIFVEVDNINPVLLKKLVSLFFNKEDKDKAEAPSLICLIANRYIDLSSADFNEIIYRYGFLIISKEEFKSANSFKWIKRSVDALQSFLYLYGKVSHKKNREAVIRQLETGISYSYLQVLLFARSRSSVYETGTPSIIDWINGALTSTPLHSGFTKNIPPLIEQGIRSGQLHERYKYLTGINS